MKPIIKAFFYYCLIFLSASSFADSVDCKATEKIYQDQLSQLSRQCSKAALCHSANLSWDKCGKAVLYSDAEIAGELTKLLADLSRICPRPEGACPSTPVTPVCFNGLCEDVANLGSHHDQVITIQFMQKSLPLTGKTVTLDMDTGIRCVTTPCPSTKNIKTFTTDQDGKIHMTVGEVLGILYPAPNSTQINQYAGPDGYSVSIDNVGYSGINLSGLLVDTHKVYVIQF